MATEKELLAKLALLQYKQDALTAGSGIAIDQNTDTISGVTLTPSLQTGTKVADINFNGSSTNLYVPNPQVREMTQAQYDALPVGDKVNNTAYFITDIPDIRIWMGTYDAYMALPRAERLKDNYLFFIIPQDAEEEPEPEEEEEE